MNSDLIKFVEQAPDTVITLVNGEKIVVRESAQEVLERVVQFRRSVLQGIMLWWDNRAAISPVLESDSRWPPTREAGREVGVCMDKATLAGLVLAIGGILLGLMLEGGNLGRYCSRPRP